MEDREPGKKCLCKKCSECNFYRHWKLVNERGEEKIVMRCSLMLLCDEIPRIRGSVDGCQAAANETRNRVLEYGTASVRAIRGLSQAVPHLVNKMALENACPD